MSSLRALIVTWLMLALVGCSVFSSDDTPISTPLELEIVTSKTLNPSQFSNANPVVVTLYQLSSIQDIKNAEVIDLAQNDNQVLAKTLVEKERLGSVIPATKKSQTLSIQPNSQFLAVFVAFSNYADAKTTAWVDVSDLEDTKKVVLNLEGLSATMTMVKDDSWW